MTPSDATARIAIQHFIVHDDETGNIVWPLSEARDAVRLWFDAAGDAACTRWVGAEEAAGSTWEVFHADPTDERPQFVAVAGIAAKAPDLLDAVTAATSATVQPVLLLDQEPDTETAARLRNAGWRLTDAHHLLRERVPTTTGLSNDRTSE